MKKKLVVLLSVLLVATNCMYVSAAPLSVLGDSNTVIVDDETSEEISEEEVSEEEISEEEISEEEESEEVSEEEKSEEKSEEASEENSEETESEVTSEVDDFDGEDIKNIDNLDDEIIELDATEQGFEYEIEGDYAVITGYSGSAVKVTIPKKLGGKPVEAIGREAFKGKTDIEQVIIPGCVTHIYDEAFKDCSGMTSLTLNEGLKFLGGGAFASCSSLEKVTIPSTVEKEDSPATFFYEGAFENCTALISVTMKNTAVNSHMFMGCTELTKVTLPANVQYVGAWAFKNCTGLEEVSAVGVTWIGEGAFAECKYLEKITLKKTVYIGISAFEKSGLVSIDLPSTTKTIDRSAFHECEYLEQVTLREGLETIGTGAFGCCTKIKEITIPSTVTAVGSSLSWGAGYGAFDSCSALEKATINNAVVGDRMFAGCTSLKQLTFSKTTNGIGFEAFYGCSSLTEVTINSSGTIGYAAFCDCSKLTSVSFKGSVKEIGQQAFANTNVEKIVLPNTVTKVGWCAFENCSNLKKLTLNDGLTALDIGAFSYCTSLVAVVIPKSVTNVSNNIYQTGVFEGCTSLIDIAVKNSIIGARMFQGCTSLKAVAIPSNVKTIGHYAFSGCSKLTAAQFTGNAPAQFGDYVFSDTSSSFEIRYLSGKKGWTNPWKGYKTRQVDKLKGDVYTIFEDVFPDDWFLGSVQYVYDKGIMAGNSATEFGSKSTIKREAVVQVLYANEGKPAVSGSSGFKDVVAGAWYEKAVIWAKNKGIASGKPDGTFGVGNEITRESLAIMLYKYAQLKKIKTGKTTGASNGYSDSAKISSYAKDAMDWAVTQGVLDGKGTGDKSQKRLDPAGKATRAEFAAMITKLLK